MDLESKTDQAAKSDADAYAVSPVAGKPDLDSAPSSGWSEKPFPIAGGGPTRMPVVIGRDVLDEIHKHGKSSPEVEVCGVLVGNGYRDARGPYVYVEASVRGEHAGNQNAQVTFTAETWTYIQEVMDRKYPGARMLGWYHTHPGFGIFLSPMDLFIHNNFFNAPEQLALVYDPHSGDEGLFVWREGEAVRGPFLVAGEDAGKKPAMQAGAGLPPDVVERLQNLEHSQHRTRRRLLVVLLFALLWPLLLLYTFARSPAPPPGDTGRTGVDREPADGDAPTRVLKKDAATGESHETKQEPKGPATKAKASDEKPEATPASGTPAKTETINK